MANPSEGKKRPFEAMVQGPFAALLRVPVGGFNWHDGLVAFDGNGVGNANSGPWLVRSDSLYERQYPPLDVPNLHRRFARTEATDKSILAFANKYGFLGHSLALRDPEGKSQSIQIAEIPQGESLGFWQREIARMARLVALWELVKHGSKRELNHLVQWTPRGEPQQVRLYLVVEGKELRPDLSKWMWQRPDEFRDHVRQTGNRAGRVTYAEGLVLAHEEIGSHLELLERWRHGDPVEPARYFVHREVNRRLRNHVSPAVLPFRKGEIRFFPDCLLSSLYTQFLLELSGRNRPAIVCARPGCGRYFEPAHGRQQYCERQCQQLAYYYRKKEKGQTN